MQTIFSPIEKHISVMINANRFKTVTGAICCLPLTVLYPIKYLHGMTITSRNKGTHYLQGNLPALTCL